MAVGISAPAAGRAGSPEEATSARGDIRGNRPPRLGFPAAAITASAGTRDLALEGTMTVLATDLRNPAPHIHRQCLVLGFWRDGWIAKEMIHPYFTLLADALGMRIVDLPEPSEASGYGWAGWDEFIQRPGGAQPGTPITC